jgi:DNA-binding transcriptional ArsR family regulator
MINVSRMTLSEDNGRRVSAVLNALGNPIRLRIIDLVGKTERPLHIKAIAKVIKKDYAAVYRHVKVLEKSGLVGVYAVGRSRVIYLKKRDLVEGCVRTAQEIVDKA